jgi:catechol 2,3-dioxygenase-like lactoylglutathione lyase family enzyme
MSASTDAWSARTAPLSTTDAGGAARLDPNFPDPALAACSQSLGAPMSFAARGGQTDVSSATTQEEVVSKTATRIGKVGTICVPVSDQERAISFYVETLGLEKRTDVPFGDGYRWVEVGPAGAETTIAIVPPPPGKPTGDVQTGICLNTDDVDAVHADLKERGVDVDAEVSRMGDPVPPMFWFRDPDGNTLMVVEV